MENKDIQVIAAPSILGLRPSGVELLADRLIELGLMEELYCSLPLLRVKDLNERYSSERDAKTACLNPEAIREFSVSLGSIVKNTVSKGDFALVLGGDCSILLGAMLGLRALGRYGLVFIDAHADFYAPHQSVTGELADMDLGLVLGKGPEILVNINDLEPYVLEEHVIHVGQRDQEETREYGSDELRDTSVRCFDLELIRKKGMDAVRDQVLSVVGGMEVSGLWLHLDLDVLDDAVNPAVEYRIAGGLSFSETEGLLAGLLATGKVAGMTVTVFNPALDKDGSIAIQIRDMICKAFHRVA